MKSSLLISLIILSIGSYFGWTRNEQITRMKQEVIDLTQEAERLGLAVETDVPGETMRVSQRDMQIESRRKEIVTDILDELILMMRAFSEVEKDGGAPSPEVEKNAATLIKQMITMTPQELEMMVDLLKENSDIDEDEKQDMATFSIMMLTSQSPRTALDIMVKGQDLISQEFQGDYMLASALGSDAKEDPFAAIDWLKENGNQVGEITDEMRSQILMGAAAKNLTQALGMAKDVGFESKAEAYNKLSKVLSDTAEVETYLLELSKASLSTGEQKNVLLRLADGPWVKDFEKASTWLDGNEAQPEVKDHLIAGMNYYQVQNSSKEWLGWLQAQEGDKAQDASGRLISGWATEDFRAAGEWLNEQKTGPSKQTMVRSYAKTLSRHEPAAAADWATTLPSGEERTMLHKTIYKNWQSTDAEAAAEFARKHGVKIE